MKLMTVAGTRPELIRLSRIVPLLDEHFDHTFIYTGQNFSANLSDVFFRDLGIRDPDRNLQVETSSFGRQLATLFESFEETLDDFQPQQVLLLGDTNSALVAFNCKRRGIPVYHMEAGNRCFDDRVPEEVNRRVIDHCSSVLLPYTERSADNLVREGIPRQRIFVTGNPIFEVLQYYAPKIDAANVFTQYSVEAGNYVLATVHRAENTDSEATFNSLLDALVQTSAETQMPVILSMHPRIVSRVARLARNLHGVRCVEAMPFFDFVALEKQARIVLTDSGTVQEECAILGVPVVTLRNTSERPETVEHGSNIVASTKTSRILSAVRTAIAAPTPATWRAPEEYLRANVSRTVLNILLSNPEWTTDRHVAQTA